MTGLSEESLLRPVPGELITLTDGVRRLTAPNPSLMTGPGTNSYIIGRERLVVIDPGPEEETHLAALAEAAAGRLRAVIVTHTHPDHAPGARRLAALTGAKVLGFEEREGFVPDACLREGDLLELSDLALRAIHTPGHASDHLCYLIEGDGGLMFSGDHVMGGSTVVIAPPDGDMAAYLSSLERLLEMGPAIAAIAPGHGPALADPESVLRQYIAHRLSRERSVLAALSVRHEASLEEIVGDVYTDVPEVLHPIARYSVWAHLLKLETDGLVNSPDGSDPAAPWRAGPPA